MGTLITEVAGAEKQAISLRLMPMFFGHPRNGKEIKDVCHFGSRNCRNRDKVTRSQVSQILYKYREQI
ncbi:MAG: hypothetical protein AMS27_08220 [Bacteroides sp. SM23_62_1]|nr:MAG: hypothetical protein AMS27_08220 [Bacteroides sp. SM23_62_1]